MRDRPGVNPTIVTKPCVATQTNALVKADAPGVLPLPAAEGESELVYGEVQVPTVARDVFIAAAYKERRTMYTVYQKKFAFSEHHTPSKQNKLLLTDYG